MSKSILVIDTPENCASCRIGNINLRDMSKGGMYCQLNKRRDILWENAKNGKPDWCPLKDVPEKKEITDDDFELAVHVVWNKAWNACIDEILKDTCAGNGTGDCPSCDFMAKMCDTLAEYEDMLCEPAIESMKNDFITMANHILEYVCDNRCKIPVDTEYTQDDVDEICEKCKFSKNMKVLMNSYKLMNGQVMDSRYAADKCVTTEELINLVNSIEGEFVIKITFDKEGSDNTNTDVGGDGLG